MAGQRGSSELGLAAASVHGGSPAVAQRGEGCMGSPSRASPRRGRWCGDRAAAVKKRRWRRSVWAVLGHRDKRMSRERCDRGRWGSPFI
jgi:hypothetical protein